jgi:hypothetical protein
MRKISMSLLLVFFSIMAAYAQIFKMDSVKIFKKQKLTFDEANIVSSYYNQDGNNSAVTGGIGTEKLTDFSNVLDMKFTSYNGNGIKTSIGAEVGVDYYSSASSDNIDFRVSSASSNDLRFYPSINYSRTDENKQITFGANLAYSSEFDYVSKGGGVNFSKSYNNEITEIGLKANVYLDDYRLYLPVELRTSRRGETRSRNSYDLGLSFSHALSSKFQFSLLLDLAYQQGFLSTPFHRVYLQNSSIAKLEILPESRLKIPIGLRANYYLSNKAILRTFYRFYKDDWNMVAHTFQAELPIKLSNSFALSPFMRIYDQKGVSYFRPFQQGLPGDEFITSDYDLSTFTSSYFGASVRYTPFKIFFNKFALQAIEIKSGIYNRSNGLDAFATSINLQFKGF